MECLEVSCGPGLAAVQPTPGGPGDFRTRAERLCCYNAGARLQGWMGQEVPVTAPQDDKAHAAPEAAPYSNPADVPSHPPRRPRGRPPSRRPLPQGAPQQGPLLGLSPAPSGSMGQVRSSLCCVSHMLFTQFVQPAMCFTSSSIPACISTAGAGHCCPARHIRPGTAAGLSAATSGFMGQLRSDKM